MKQEELYRLLGYLRDSGTSMMVMNRIRDLAGGYGTLDEFLDATPGALMAAYNATHPESSKGLGKHTLEAFDRARRGMRMMHATDKVEEAAAVANHEALLLEARRQLGQEAVDLSVLKETVAWLSLMFTETTVGELLEAYRKVAEKAAEAEPKTHEDV